MEEVNFPRGGVVTKSPSVQDIPTDEPDLFSVQDVKEDTKRGQKRKLNEKIKVKTKNMKFSSDQILAGGIEILNSKRLCTEMLLLGCVREINDYELIIGLANGLQGFVSIVDIADGYRDLLQKFTEMTKSGEIDSNELEVPTLHELFKVGQVLPCKVSQHVANKIKRDHVKLTINPKDINRNLSVSTIRNSMTLFGSIASVEDHGYVMDLGVRGLQVFLSSNDAEKFVQLHNEGYPLRIGQNMICRVKGDTDTFESLTGDRRTVGVTVDPQKVIKATLRDSVKVALTCLLPGMKVVASVQKTHAGGLTVKFLRCHGSIHRMHLPQSPLKYSNKQEMKCCILGIHPTTKTIMLSALPHLVDYKGVVPPPALTSLSIGQIFEDATVVNAMTGHGVSFSLQGDLVGFANLRHLPRQKTESLGKCFKQGSTHKCRVLDLCFVDNVAIVTLNPKILRQKFLSFSDIKPGELIQCTVKAMMEDGMVVRLTRSVRGFVPSLHYADIPLKHPEKKFNQDQRLNCRVLSCDPSKNRLTLTLKKSLVNTELPLITEMEQMKPGMEAEGFIVNIKDKGVLVAFYNNVKGWVPQRELGYEPVPYPSRVFYKGQVVRCGVLSMNLEKKNLTLTFKVKGKSSVKTKSVEVPSDFEVGKLIVCKVKRKLEKGLDVELFPSGNTAFLPKYHLSDSMEMCELMLDRYIVGDMIDVMYYSCQDIVIVTKKRSIIELSTNHQLSTVFTQIMPGIMMAGRVQNMLKYGIFVEFPGGLIGLAPTQYTTDKKAPDLSLLFHIGQSVLAKVIEVSAEKQRFLISLRMKDCYSGDHQPGIDLLKDYMQEKNKLLKSIVQIKDYHSKIGCVETAVVGSISKSGIHCHLPGGVKGFIPESQKKGLEIKEKEELEVVILNIDPLHSCLDLSACQNLVKLIKHRKDNKFSEAKVGQVIKSEVELVRDDFILVSLRGHTGGQLAYLPARRHLNDVLEQHQFDIGQPNAVVVKENADGQIIVVLQIHEAKAQEHANMLKREHSVHPGQMNVNKLKVGMTVKAKICSILEQQMNVMTNEVPGRIHITEVVDAMENGGKPFSSYKEGMEVSAKVIGFREPKTHGIASRPRHMLIPELSLRPSKMEMDQEKISSSSAHKYKVGDRVLAVIQHHTKHFVWMHVGPNVRGRVSLLNLSNDLKILEHPQKHFQPGQCYTVTIIGIQKDGTLELSLTESKETVTCKKGSLVKAIILSIQSDKGIFVELAEGYKGIIGLTDLLDDYKDRPLSVYHCGQVIKCNVVSADPESPETCVLSLRKSRCTLLDKKKIVDPDIQQISQLREGMILRGFISCCQPTGVTLCIGQGISSFVPFSHISERYIKSPETIFYPGKVVTTKVISVDTDENIVKLSMLKKDTGLKEYIPKSCLGEKRSTDEPVSRTVVSKKSPRKRKSSQSDTCAVVKKKTKTKSELDADSGIEINKDSDSDQADVEEKVSHPEDAPRLQLAAGFSWDTEFKIPEPEEPDNSSSDESESGKKQIKKKKTKEEKKKEKEEEEKKIFELERRRVEGEMSPETADDFDRLVLQSPNSSIVWLGYMAFHLETTEIDKARAIAERGLKTISFREEQEKMNLWIGYLNLENMYGTQETLDAVLSRAVQQSDALLVYQQMVHIYVQSGKIQAAEQLYSMIVKRYSQNKAVWIGFGQFLFKQAQCESARKLMQRCLKSLDKREHLDVISKFAMMEYKFPGGEPERGRTMFENILSNYPKRTDLWSVYIDMVTKQNDKEAARQLFDRVTCLKLPARKMKLFFKKYMDFEERHGDIGTVDAVKLKALQYVESQQHKDV